MQVEALRAAVMENAARRSVESSVMDFLWENYNLLPMYHIPRTHLQRVQYDV